MVATLLVLELLAVLTKDKCYILQNRLE